MKKMYIGLMTVAIIVLLFASGCTTPRPTPRCQDEPSTLEGYKSMCNWELYDGQLYKCEVVSNRLEITWDVPKQGEMEEDIQVWHKSDWLNSISNMNSLKVRTRNGLDIYSLQVMTATFYYFCSTNNYCLLYGDTRIEDKYLEEFLCK